MNAPMGNLLRPLASIKMAFDNARPLQMVLTAFLIVILSLSIMNFRNHGSEIEETSSLNKLLSTESYADLGIRYVDYPFSYPNFLVSFNLGTETQDSITLLVNYTNRGQFTQYVSAEDWSIIDRNGEILRGRQDKSSDNYLRTFLLPSHCSVIGEVTFDKKTSESISLVVLEARYETEMLKFSWSLNDMYKCREPLENIFNASTLWMFGPEVDYSTIRYISNADGSILINGEVIMHLKLDDDAERGPFSFFAEFDANHCLTRLMIEEDEIYPRLFDVRVP